MRRIAASAVRGWAPNMPEFACSWTSPQGEALRRAQGVTPFPYGHAVTQAVTPLPCGHTVLLWCLPSKSLAEPPEPPEPRTARAVVALLRVTPTS